ncbi:discoidin domain-containing protein [Catellatospora sp. KI3]|uniref:galactose-binding domain-containing protein n=1 Tax=Catellatospora sp. KI3 TaxID=3041620 RepID=UPI00248321FF|nr:discoidin domain-containing protein [Catellatospora sp. KI3]MDI1462135.1 discoidin domain-containing protein [Catellatospora sp. KI3]
MSPEPLPGIAAPPRRRRKLLVATSAALLALVGTYAFAVPAAHAADPLISVGKTATASSLQGADLPASNAVDGNAGTRWGSAWSDPQWIQIDLGATAAISQVVLQWEGASAKAFQLQVSGNGTSWTDIYSTTTGPGGTQTLAVSGSGRYIRMYGTQRNSGYGYSLFEFGVYGVIGGTQPSPSASPTPSTSPGACALASQGRPAAASSAESGTAAAAFDGNSGTRWGSLFTDPQWIQVDLGSTKTLCQVQLEWETASAKAFQLQVSNDAANWTSVYSTTTGPGGTQNLAVSGSGRYVRMYGTQRNTGYGYSLWEFKVYAGGVVVTDPVEPTDPMNPNLGPNTFVYDPSTPTATIQSKLNQIFTEQETNQFGANRYAVLFKPGTYTADVNLGFYTQVAGLGFSPDDVNLNGHVRVEALWFGGNATQNFWRTAENLSVTLPAGNTVERWAVAQAAAYRRMHLKGAGNQIQLWNGGDGWASGGLMADTKVDGLVSSGSQQQWFSRNSEFGSWTGSVWNMVFTGVVGAPAPHFPNPSHTVVTNSPIVREKPFLYVDGTGTYRVFKPGVRTNAQGTSWYNKTPVGTSISLADFYVVRPGATAATINNALAAGKNLLFTPGVYHLNQTLQVNRADTVVLGLGLATLIPDGGITAIKVADVDGVQVAGLLIDAGTANSATLMEVGPAGSNASHAANPTSLHDVYFRIGGAGAGKATTSLVINSNNVIGDHMWLWRADHGTGVGWTVNTADTGLIVNGNDVTMYGLFVEHYQKYEVIWNGNGGRTYFFQNELPYEAPNQAAWMNGSTRGYAAYKVADSVTTHEAWGVGSYCVFTQDLSIVGERGFEVPVKPGVKFHNLVIVSLGGQGTIAHVINNTGGPANTATPTVYLNEFSG